MKLFLKFATSFSGKKTLLMLILSVTVFFSLSAQISMSSATTGVLSNASSATISYTNASGSNQVLMVGVSAQQPGSSVSTITYNGVSLTKLGNLSNSNQSRIEIWYLKSPSIGTYNLVVNNSGNDNAIIGIMTFSGVHQTSTFGTLATAQGSSALASVTAASATNDIVYSVVAFNNGSTLTQGTDQTERWDQTLNSSITGGGSTKAGATSVTMTSTSTSSAPWTAGAVALKPTNSTSFSPGGVSGAALWLKANAGTSTTTNGGTVSSWLDQSSNGWNVTQVTTANQPTFATSLPNFNPALTFDGTDDFLSRTGISYNAGSEDYFAVVLPNSVTGDRNFLGLGSTVSSGNVTEFRFSTNTLQFGVGQSWSSITSPTVTSGVWNLANANRTTSTNGAFLRNNGAQVANGTITPVPTHSQINIGARRLNSVNDQFINGQIAEVIIFPTQMTAANRNKVESYLAIKYGITLNQTTAQNYTASNGSTIFWNGTTNSTYKNNIAGIARDDASALNQKQSKSVNSGLQVVMGNGNTIATDNVSNSNNFSADLSSLVWGDNAGSVASWTSTGAPTNRQIIARTWKVQETGTVGSVKVQIADNTGTNGLPVESGTIYLLVDADGNFASGATEIAMTLNGTNWEANVDLTNGQFITFATQPYILPGGVAGSIIWLKANAGSNNTTNGGDVSSWKDQLNETNITGVNTPTYISNANNFNPAMNLAVGSSEYFTIPSGTVGFTSGLTAYVVAKPNTTGSWARLFDFGNGTANNNILFSRNGTSANLTYEVYNNTTSGGTVTSSTSPIVNGTNKIFGVIQAGGTAGASTSATVFTNGLSTVTGTTTVPQTVSRANNYIGRSNWSADAYYDGEISEIIIFNSNKTSDRLKIESYLGIKYGVTIDQTTAQNYLNSAGSTIWTGTTNSTYKNNIAGIARDDASALNQKQSKSVNSGLQIVIGNGNTIAADNISNSNDFSANLSSLIWGDNAGSVAAWTATGAPTGYRIVSRTWKVQETGTVGSVKVQVAASSGANGLPDNDSRGVLLLVDADGNFATGATAIPMTLNGTNWEANVDLTTGQFFTFANAIAPELSISLTDVTCFGGNNGAINLTVTGGATPYTYLWTASNGGVVPSGQSTNQNLTALVAGTYTVVVTSANFEQISTSVNISQSSAIVLTTVVTPVFPAGSNNGAIDLSISGGTPPYTYLWTPGNLTTQDLGGLANGNYNIAVTDSKGCIANSTVAVGNAINSRKQLYLSDPSQALDRIDPVATTDATTVQSAILSTPISIVGATASSNSAQTVSTHTFAYNSGTTGVNRALFVGVSYRNSGTNGRDINSVTYGGQAMTLVGSQENTTTLILIPTRHAKVYIYRLLNPPTGSNNLTVNWNGSLEYGAVIGATTYENVNQTTPTGAFASNTGNSSTASVSVAGATGRLMFGVVAGRTTTNYVATTSGNTQLWSQRPYSGNTAGSGQIAEGASSVNLTWSGSSDYWATAGVSIIPASVSASTSFTQSPAMCNNLIVKAGEPITISTYVSVSTGTMPVNPAITATVRYGSTNIITLNNPTYNSTTGLLTWSGTLSSDLTVPAGQSIVFDITTLQTGVSFRVDYDSQTKPSKIELPTSTVINIQSYAVYDAAYPNGSVITTIPTNSTVYLRAVVADPFGADDITGVTINVSPGGAILTPTSVATTGCTRIYELPVNTTGLESGEYSIPATAKEGYENKVTHTYPLTVQLCTPIETPVFTLGATSIRCQGGGSVTYTATSTNSTGITYSLDEASLNAGNSIVSGTGAVTYVSGWSGTTVITATASGCDGPKTSTHTVTITPTVGVPVFTLGTNSQRCMAAGAEKYTATATNTTGITYTLDAASLAAGNTIAASTGIVNYVANWSGTSTITATAAGCNGPTTSMHTVATVAIDAIDDNVSGDQGSPVVINVLTNDLCNVNPASLSIITYPQSGTVQIGSNGQLTYLPNGNFYGSDEFTYQVCSNGTPVVCDIAKVTIAINQSFNDPCSEATQAKTFYIPFPENATQLRKALWSAASVSLLTTDVRTILSIKSPYPNTIITYDQWEDGYENDITLPAQSTTLVWGDGKLTNGIAPGFPTDIIPAGGYIVIDNQFAYTRTTSTIAYDGKDKMYSTADIAVSTVKGDAGAYNGTPIFAVQNVKTNVYDVTRFGKLFVIPFGENITLGSTGAFKYTGIFIRAAKNGTIVNLDYNADEVVDITQTLNEGEVYFYDGTASTFGVAGDINQSNDIKSGGTVTSNYPVGVDLVFGGIDSYGTRNLALLPGQFYGSTYYSPVYTTLSSAPVYAFFTNSLSTPVTVNWTAGTTPTPTTGSVVIPANGANYLSLSNSAGYKFQSAGGESFTAVAVIDADADGSSYDWAFNMIAESRLTTFSSVAWAPGSNNGSANYNPVWVTPVANTTLYIKYNGNMTTATPTMSPCNLPYDIAISLSALQSYRIFDTDNDQTGLAIYTCDGTKFTAVWGQDPNVGNPTPTGSPAQDVGYVMEPRCLQQNVFATDDIEFTAKNTPIVVNVLSNDFGFLCTLNPSSVSRIGLLQPANGSIVINSDGTITYTPNPNFEGTDVFEYRVYSDEYPGLSEVALVTIKVTDCAAVATENLITGNVFVEQLPDDGAYNVGEALAQNVKVDLYIDTNCNSTVDAGENITQSTLSDLSGNYEFHAQNGLNAKDNFDPTASFSGNDGGINWSTNWLEQGDDTNLTTGDVRITPDASTAGSGNAIRIAGATNGISRSLTFSNATSATLRFSYRRQGMDNEGEALEVRMNGTTIYTIQDGDYAGGTDASYTEVIIPIPTVNYNANGNNTLYFVTNGTPATDDYFWIDNVELIYFKSSICYIVKVDPSNTNGHYSASTLNAQTASFTDFGNCDKNNYLGVKVNLTAADDARNTEINVPVNIDVISNDVIGNPNPATVTTAGMTNQPANGTVTINPDGTITYTPNTGFTGTDDFEYRVCSLEDPSVCDIALVTVTVSCVSRPGVNVVSGVVYNDLNVNGVIDVTDIKMSGVSVNLYKDSDNDGVLDTGEPLVDTKITSTLGAYLFEITPPVVINTYRDEFNANDTPNQSAGTTLWSTNSWNEIVGTANGFNTAPIRITSANGLIIEGNGTATTLGAYRTANLSTAIAATLSFNYAEIGLNLQINDYVDVLIATSSSPSSWTLLKRFTGADGNQTNVESFDITPYISPTTTIRFVTSGSVDMSASNMVYFDNIQISYNVPTAAKYIVQLAQPIPMGNALTAPLPSPTGIHTASFTAAAQGDCQNDFGLTTINAENDINQTPMNTPVSGQLLTNDEGVTSITGATIDGSPFVLGEAKQVSGIDDAGNIVTNAGSLIVNSNGIYTFIPVTGFTGTINPVIYTGVGISGATDLAKLSIEVLPKLEPGNNPPVAQNDVATTEINTSLSSTIIINDSDPDGDALTVTLASINSTPITIGSSITVSGINSAGNVVANAGTIILNANGTYTYTPATEFTGVVDDILYTISDGKGGIDAAVLSILVIGNHGNNTFTNDDANSALKGVTMNGNVLTNDFDPEGNTQTVTSASATYNSSNTSITIGTATEIPNVGSVTLNANGTYTFVPLSTFIGTIPVIYNSCDNGTPQVCDEATLYLTSLPNAVFAENDINQTLQDTLVSGQLLTNDEGVTSVTGALIGGNTIAIGEATQVSGVDHAGNSITNAGSITLNGDGTYTFTPATGFVGTVNPITYTGAGINGTTDTAILSIEVLPKLVPGNNSLKAQNDVNTTETGVTITSTVLNNDSDPDGDVITVTGFTIGGEVKIPGNNVFVVSGINSGGATVSNAGTIKMNAAGIYEFIPAPGFIGTIVDIPYSISDGKGGVDAAILSITVVGNYGNNTFANDDANSAAQGVTLNGNVITNDFDPEGNTQTVTSASATFDGSTTSITIGSTTVIPNVGSLTLNANGTYTFVPLSTFTGTVPVIYNECDNGTPQACDAATLYLTTLPKTIHAEYDFNQTPMNTEVIGQLMTNDEGVTSILAATDGTSFVFGVAKVVSGTDKFGNVIANAGTLTINSDGTYLFHPATGFVGTVSPVTYTGTDLNGNTDTAILNIKVLPQIETGNNPPVAQNDVNLTEVGVTISNTLFNNDSDPDGDAISVTGFTIGGEIKTPGNVIVVSGINTGGASVPNAGTIKINTDGTYEYIPAAGFTGTVADIPYTISDGNGGTDAAILSIHVIANNGNNTFANDDATTAPQDVNMTGNVLANDFDPEGDSQVVVSSAVILGNTITIGQDNVIDHVGTLTLNADGTYIFNPLPGFVGTLSVQYQICDNGTPQACDEATLYLTSLPGIIFAENDINQTPMNTSVSGSLLTNDEGVSSITGAIDNAGIPFTLGVAKQVAGIDLLGNIVENAGTLTVNADGTYLFVPITGFAGTIDPVTYTGSGNNVTDTAILSIQVLPNLLPGNNPPVAQNDVNTTEAGISISSTVINNDSDPDGDAITITGFTVGGDVKTPGTEWTVAGVNTGGAPVSNAGTIKINADGTYVFTPANGFIGTVNDIPYSISDGNGGTDAAILSITVVGNYGNNTFANDDANSAEQDVNMSGNVITNDFDPEGNTQTVTQATVNGTSLTIGSAVVIENVGTLTLNANGSYIFDPLPGFTGTLPVIYKICDNGTPVACDEATLYLTSLPRAVFAENDINQTPMNVPVSGQLMTNDELVVSIVNAEINGSTIVLGASTIVSGIDKFGNSVTNAGSIIINNDGTYTFTPVEGFVGTVNPIDYTGKGFGVGGATDNAILSIEVLPKVIPGNNPPVAQNDVNTTEVNISVSSTVLNNDSDPDGDAITVTTASITLGTAVQVAGTDSYGNAVANAGTVMLNADGTYTYVPATGFIGTVNDITYNICDGVGGSCSAILSIKVIGNDGNSTFANDDANSAPQGTTLTGSVVTNDFDPEGNLQTVTGATINGSAILIGDVNVIENVGSLTVNADGTYTFVPLATYTGTLPVIYNLCDNGTPQACDQATLYLTLLPKIVIAVNDINQTPQNTQVSGQLITNDKLIVELTDIIIEGNPATLGMSTTVGGVDINGDPVANAGSIVINSNGTYTFTPVSGFVGRVNAMNYTGRGLSGATDYAVLLIEVLPRRAPGLNPPVAHNDDATTEIDVPVSSTVLANDSDPDGDPITVTNADVTLGTPVQVAGVDSYDNPVTNAGTITLNSNGTYTFTPATGFVGSVNDINYTISDGKGGESTAVLKISVVGNNGNNTFASDDANSSIQGTTMTGNVLNNDTDPEANSQTVTGATINGNAITLGVEYIITGVGAFTLNSDGTYTFVPLPGFIGTLPVIYQKCDNGTPVACDMATLYLTTVSSQICFSIKALLQGAMLNNGGGTLMRDNLRKSPFTTQNYIPTSDPYSTAAYNTKFVRVLDGLNADLLTDPNILTIFADQTNVSDNIVDWVFVELRSKTNNKQVISTRSVLVQRDGDFVDVNGSTCIRFPATPVDDYYVVVRHRNHLGVMTRNPISVSVLAGGGTVDFTDSIATPEFNFGKTYPGATSYNFTGLSQVTFNGKRALWCGNAAQDSRIKYQPPTDDTKVVLNEVIYFNYNIDGLKNNNYNLAIGYFAGDINMNSKVKYQAPSDDVSYILNQVLFYPLNSAYNNNFNLMLQQIPY